MALVSYQHRILVRSYFLSSPLFLFTVREAVATELAHRLEKQQRGLCPYALGGLRPARARPLFITIGQKRVRGRL